jgi:hypothetical protein
MLAILTTLQTTDEMNAKRIENGEWEGCLQLSWDQLSSDPIQKFLGALSHKPLLANQIPVFAECEA